MRAVSIEDVKEGAVLARSLVNEEMIVMISEGTILTKAHITRLKFLNIPVIYIKDEYELSKNYQAASAVFSKSNAFTKDYDEALLVAKEIFFDIDKEKEKKSADAQDALVQTLERDATFASAAAQALVDTSITPLTKSSGVIDYLFDISHMASGLYQHSLRVSIMSGVIAKWMRYDSRRQKEIVMAGFFHDVGKTKIEDRVLGKNLEKLQGADLATYRNHTVLGYQILQNMPNITESVRRVALEHHELMDGSGFPRALKGGEIHIYSSIVSLANFYDNATTEREGYVKQTPFDAIKYVTENLYTILDPIVCVPFLTHIKDAFLGSRVTLNNGVNGKVAAFPNDFAASPIIAGDNGEIINLNKEHGIKIIEYNPKE